MNDNTIYVHVKENSKATLTFTKYNIKSDVFIGKNGASEIKEEGNKKTPIGTFSLGKALGTHSQTEMQPIMKVDYTQINKNMYWVDDVNSLYYNQLIDITKTPTGWNSAEHLIDYPTDYEFLIEIKSNPENISGKGSAIFIHCSNEKPTLGCIGVNKEIMKSLMQLIDKDTKIVIG